MNQDQLEGKFKQFKGKLKQKWGQLTDDDLEVMMGHRDEFLGCLQERVGLAREEAEKQLKEWERANPDFRWQRRRIGVL